MLQKIHRDCCHRHNRCSFARMEEHHGAQGHNRFRSHHLHGRNGNVVDSGCPYGRRWRRRLPRRGRRLSRRDDGWWLSRRDGRRRPRRIRGWRLSRRNGGGRLSRGGDRRRLSQCGGRWRLPQCGDKWRVPQCGDGRRLPQSRFPRWIRRLRSFAFRPGFAPRVNRVAFARFNRFHNRRFFAFAAAPVVAGVGLYGGSCWSWQPTPWGWQRVWACDYDYGYYGYY
jgi:hypothetical protein